MGSVVVVDPLASHLLFLDGRDRDRRGADRGHAEVGRATSGAPHGGQLLLRGGKTGLDRGDLAEPSLFFGLLEPVEEAGVDLFQTWHLGWVNS